MAIVPLINVTLLGPASGQESLLGGMQRLGCMHVTDISPRRTEQPWEHPHRNDLQNALRYLESCPTQRPPLTHPTDDRPRLVAQEVLDNRQRRRELQEQKEQLTEAIKRTTPWGDFRVPSAGELGGLRLWFYRLKPRQIERLPARIVRTVVSADREFTYLVVVAAQPPAEIAEPPVELDARPLSDLRAELAEVDEQIDAVELERIALTRWCHLLRRDLDRVEEEIERVTTADRLWREEAVVAMQGWVPQPALPDLQAFAQERRYALSIRDPSPVDDPPTLLRNPAPVDGAEDAVTFFMTPHYRGWDPSWVMFFSFSLFFAMITADAGYGLVLAVILAAVSGRLSASIAGRRFRHLAWAIVVVTVLYGVLIGSYFGFTPPAGSWPDRLVIKSGAESIASDREAMMLLSATIGVIHLALANLIVAWQRRGTSRALGNLGWAAGVAGGWAMAVSMLPKPDAAGWLATRFGGQADRWSQLLWEGGSVTLAVGLAMVGLFSSDRPLLSARPRDWLMRPLEGLMALTGVTKAFGDALSYLRLFALGLASAQLAMVFNQLAADAMEIRGVGLLFGLMIFLIGHTLNLVLATVGGVVHGLRLNCIEFFSWSLSDEGRPFQPFGKRLSADE